MAMMRCYTASWIVPVTSPPVPRGALLVDTQGRIAAVGPLEAMPPEAAASTWVMPS
jgi:hypothetical protein